MLSPSYHENFQIKVKGIGLANILTISQAHKSLGISRQECLKRILSAPAILASGLDQERALPIEAALHEYHLPCEIVAPNTPLAKTDCHYEVACHIHDFSQINEFAAEVAAFTGQTSEEIIQSLTQVPAVLIGNISQQAASDIAQRFSKPGIELIPSNTHKAVYTVLAFMLGYSETVRSQYIALGLQPKSQSRDCKQWIATDVTLSKTQKIWQKCTELNLPLSIQNHDYLRFDISLTAVDNLTNNDQLHTWLSTTCGIPEAIHQKLLAQLPIVIKRGQNLQQSQQQLHFIRSIGATGEALATHGMRFDLEVAQLAEHQHPAFSKLINTITRKQPNLSKLSSQRIALGANAHQAHWIAYEAKKAGIKVRLIRTLEMTG